MMTTTRPVAAILAAPSVMGSQVSNHSARGGGECGLTHDPVEHADGRDADLDGGEKLCGIVVQAHGGHGTGIAGFGHHLQSGFATGSQGHFRHGKDAIEQNQKNQ